MQNVSSDYVSIGEAADVLGVSIDTLRRWDASGKLVAQRIDGKNRYYDVADLQNVLSRQELSVSEVASVLGVSVSSVRRLENSGELTTHRSATGRRFYEKKDVEAFVAKRAAPAQKQKNAQLTPVVSATTNLEKSNSKIGALNSTGLFSLLVVRQRGSVFMQGAGGIAGLVLICVGLTLPFISNSARNDSQNDRSLESALIDAQKNGLRLNLDSASVKGYQPGSDNGNLAVVPLDGMQILDGSLTGNDIADGALRLSHLSDELRQFIDASGPASSIQGLPGEKGDKGDQGSQGVAGQSNITSLLAGLGLSGGGNLGQVGLDIQLATSGSGSSSSSVSGLEVSAQGLGLLGGCTINQLLKWNGSAWQCSSDLAGGGTLDVQEGGMAISSPASALNFAASDFSVSDNLGQANIAIDYVGSAITRSTSAQAITGTWSFLDSGFILQDNADTSKRLALQLSGITSGSTRTLTVPNVDGTLITSGNLSSINSVGTITSGTWQGSTLAVQYGGTGSTTFNTNGILYGNGGSAIQSTGGGSAGQILVANGGGVPTFASLSGDASLNGSGVITFAASGVTAGVYGSSTQVPVFTVDAKGRVTAVTNTTINGVAPGGAAGGDLSGSYPGPTVSRINGTPLGATTPTAGNILIANGTTWATSTISGDISLAVSGVVALADNSVTTNRIANANVTNAKLANSSLTVTAGTGLSGGGAVSLGGTTALNVVYGSTAATAVEGNRQLTINAGTGLSGGSTITLGAGGSSTLSVAYGSAAGTAVQGNTLLTCAAGIGNLSGGGNSITLGAGGSCGTLSINDDVSFATAVRTPLITNNNDLTVSVTGAGNDLTLSSGNSIVLSGFNCSSFTNGGVLTTDVNGVISCTNDDGGAAGTISGAGTSGRLAFFNGSASLADSWLVQNGSNLQLDSGRNIELLGGDVTAASFIGNLSGNATSATSLAADPSDCAANQFATSIAANGDLSCASLTDVNIPDTLTIGAGSTVADSALSGNVTLQGNVFNGVNQLVRLNASGFLPSLNGSLLSNVNASLLNGQAASFYLDLANATGALSLGVQTNGDYVASIGSVTGLSVTGATGEGSTPALSVLYGAAANTAVQGDTNITVNAGSNLSGGGSITLGAGGSITLNTTPNPSFATSVTTPVVEGLSSLLLQAISPGADITLSAADQIILAGFDCSGFVNGGSLTVGAGGVLACSNDDGGGAGAVSGSGTSGRIPVFNGVNSIANSVINQSGGSLEIDAGTAVSLLGGNLSVTGLATISGNINTTTGGLRTASTTRIANDGTLQNVTGAAADGVAFNANTITSGTINDLRLSNNVTLQGNTFNGANQLVQLTSGGALPSLNGAALTGVNAALLNGQDGSFYQDLANATGVLSDARLSANVTLQGNSFNGVSQLVQTTSLGYLPALDGSLISSVDAALLGGQPGAYYLDLANAVGTLSDARLSSNVTLQGNTFNGANQLVQLTSGGAFPSLDGSALTNVNATLLNGQVASYYLDLANTAGTLTALKGGTGVDGSVAANGSLLIGNGSGYSLGTLSQGDGVLIANGAGSITISSVLGATVSSSEIEASAVTLGTQTTGDFIATLGTLAGLATSGNSGEGSTPTLSVLYGSSTGTAVQGDTSLVCAAGTGNLSGGGNTITLGAGGTCGAISMVSSPTFSTLETTSLILGADTVSDLTGTGLQIVLGALEVALGTSISTGEIDDDAVALGSKTSGNYVQSILAGNGVSVTAAGEGVDTTVSLGQLTGDWNQAGPYDVLLNNADSELRILESDGGVFFGTLDAGNLNANATYSFTGPSGTVLTSGNFTSTLDAAYVTNTQSPAAGDIVGSFQTGLTINDGVVTNTKLQNSTINVSYGANLSGDSSVALGGILNLTLSNSPAFSTVNATTFFGTLNGNASTASTLAADPTDCVPDTYAIAISANGNLTCDSIADAALSANVTKLGSDIDINTETTGNLLANRLQNAAADLGAADVNINLSNTNGAFVTNLTLDGQVTAATFNGSLNGNASTASALAADPMDCAANQVARAIAANGNLSCSALTDADIPNNITIDLAATANNLVGVGSVTNAVDLQTAEVAGNLRASNLQNAAADLGAADVNINLSNTNGAFVTNLTLDGIITASSFSGALTGNASTATALAADPTDCAANQFARAIIANGNLTCAAITDADIPNSITIDLASTATALAANPVDCAVDQYATTIAANGNLTCAGITEAQVSGVVAEVVAGTGLSGGGASGVITLNVGEGNGIESNADTVGINLLDVLDGTGLTNSRSGLEFGGAGNNELTLLQGCAEGESLKWSEASAVWQCGSDRATSQIRKGADETVTNSAALQNDDVLTFNVGANETWIVEYHIQYTSPAAQDIRFAVTAPTASTCTIGMIDGGATATAATANTPCATAIVTTTDSATDEEAIVYGTVVTGANTGAITLQWAQGTAGLGTNTIVRAGSYLKAFKVSGADLAEIYYSKNGAIEPGSVVSMDSSITAGVMLSRTPYDSQMYGVVATNPGLIIGDATGSGAPVHVALSGRVPVKVSTENGSIKAGDFLTSSSTPGVAMKATKAGSIIGVAMEDYSGSTVGRVIVYVQHAQSGGVSYSDRALSAESILASLTKETSEYAALETDLSSIFTDRVTAGLEIITPKLIASEVAAESLIIGNNGLQFKLSSGQIIGSLGIDGAFRAADAPAATQGRTEQAASTEEVSGAVTSDGSSVSFSNMKLGSLTIETSLFTGGALTVVGPALFQNTALFKMLATFESGINVAGAASFSGNVSLPSNSGGFTSIPAGSQRVRVTFSQPHSNIPAVSVTAGQGVFQKFAYDNLTSSGFDIVLEEPATAPVQFSWTALTVN